MAGLHSTTLEARENKAIYRAMKIIKTRLKDRPVEFQTALQVRQYLTLNLSQEDRELFVCLFLDSQHKLIESETLFAGSLNQTEVHPRVIAKKVLEFNASSVIVAHNHPSGACKPSDADIQLTEKLKDGLGLLDIKVLDHIIVAGCDTYSFAEHGMI